MCQIVIVRWKNVKNMLEIRITNESNAVCARVFSLRMRLLTQHARALALLAFTRCHCRVARRTQHVKRFNLILKFIPASKEDQRQHRERQTKLDLDSEHLIEIWFCNFPF